MPRKPKTKIVTYTEPDELLAEIGEELIAKHFPFLKDARIDYLMRTRENEGTDKVVEPRVGEAMGSAKAAGAVDRLLHNWDFRIIVSGNCWAKLNDHDRRALLYHQLCHCDMHEGRPRLTRPDFDGFLSELTHFGTWAKPLKDMQEAFLQSQLDFADEVAETKQLEPEPAQSGA